MMHGWTMDGLMDAWTDGMDTWMHGVCGCMSVDGMGDGRMHGWMHGWMHGCMEVELQVEVLTRAGPSPC